MPTEFAQNAEKNAETAQSACFPLTSKMLCIADKMPTKHKSGFVSMSFSMV